MSEAPTGNIRIAEDDPRVGDVRGLLEVHLANAHETTPPEHVRALDVDGLVDPRISFYSLRRDGMLLGIGALSELDAVHGEVKSMHTAATARRQGVGRAILVRLLGEARTRGYRRVSLETGTMENFAPARALYDALGFVTCEPFADYERTVSNMFMTLELR